MHFLDLVETIAAIIRALVPLSREIRAWLRLRRSRRSAD